MLCLDGLCLLWPAGLIANHKRNLRGFGQPYSGSRLAGFCRAPSCRMPALHMVTGIHTYQACRLCFQLERFTTALKRAVVCASAVFSRLATFLAFLDDLQLQAAIPADIDPSQFHVVAACHSSAPLWFMLNAVSSYQAAVYLSSNRVSNLVAQGPDYTSPWASATVLRHLSKLGRHARL